MPEDTQGEEEAAEFSVEGPGNPSPPPLVAPRTGDQGGAAGEQSSSPASLEAIASAPPSPVDGESLPSRGTAGEGQGLLLTTPEAEEGPDAWTRCEELWRTVTAPAMGFHCLRKASRTKGRGALLAAKLNRWGFEVVSEALEGAAKCTKPGGLAEHFRERGRDLDVLLQDRFVEKLGDQWREEQAAKVIPLRPAIPVQMESTLDYMRRYRRERAARYAKAQAEHDARVAAAVREAS